MKNITILLPIHILEENETIMLSKALESIEVFHNDIKLSIICPTEISKKLKDFDFGQKLEVNVIENKKLTNFQSQINLGIENCDTEWFSILEIDDVYNETWLASITEYIKAFPTVEVFLPIVRDVNTEGKFVSFTNESVWAYGFTDKLGYLNNETLLEFQNYQTSGGLFKTETVNKFGGFKDNIKLTFVYEFLLRLTYNSVNIAVVPKVGYQHVVMRENSLFWNLRHDEKEKIEPDEVKFWIETAKTEYFFKNKREVNYQKP
jgi:hypothetical protein